MFRAGVLDVLRYGRLDSNGTVSVNYDGMNGRLLPLRYYEYQPALTRKPRRCLKVAVRMITQTLKHVFRRLPVLQSTSR